MPNMTNTTADGGAIDPMEVLKEDLFGLYYGAGRNVTYLADSGEVRAYWPNRYLQGLKRAVDISAAEVLAYARRMVVSDAPSRGFGYLEAAGRLDLTVEALVADRSRPYHHLFDEEMVGAAVERLAEHGSVVQGATQSPDSLATAAVAETPGGFAVELTVEVTRDGAVLLHADGYTATADGTLSAVNTFVRLLAQAEAAASGGA
jgi:hypothetical protein